MGVDKNGGFGSVGQASDHKSDAIYYGTQSGRYTSEQKAKMEALEKYLKEQEAFKRYIGVADWDIKKVDGSSRIGALKESQKVLKDKLNKIERCIEQAGTLKFKEGDVIYHKDHGPVVINEVVVDLEDMSRLPDTSISESYKFYYKGYAKGGSVAIKADEALPYNETTKLLYEKSRTE